MLQEMVIALAHVVTRGGSVRISVGEMPARDRLAFFWFKARWAPHVKWTLASEVN